MNLKDVYNYFNSFTKDQTILFYIENYLCGYILPSFVDTILTYFPKDFYQKNNSLFLHDKYNTFDNRSLFFKELSQILNEKGIIDIRNEDMLVPSIVCNKALCKIDRALTNYLGTKSDGIHINAYVEKNGEKYLWISRRSKNILDPLQYDNLVAGGVSHGFSIFDTVLKEAEEEAGIPRELAIKSLYKNNFSYIIKRYFGIRNDAVYIFDLQLPENFIPIKQDEEIEDIHLLPLKDVYNLIKNGKDFKFNSMIVTAYFLLENSNLLSSEDKNYINLIIN
jgi:8-oxo-dGTP pyrophosphatase MutT (NUDIX family)